MKSQLPTHLQSGASHCKNTSRSFSKRDLWVLLFALTLFTGCAAGCATMRNAFRPKETLPTLWNQPPTLNDILTNLRRHSAAMQSLATNDATLSLPGVALPLSASLYVERPRSIRLRGSASAITGQELDFGSNNDLFWFWGKRLTEREMYYARHDQFATSPVRATLPIEPAWLMESLGFLSLDKESYDEPQMRDRDTCELVARRQTPAGMQVKKITINARTGCVLRQEIYDPQNNLLAVAQSSDHRTDKATGIVYARRVEIQCQGATGKITLDLGTPTFNSHTAIPQGVFTKPIIPGYTDVDLASPAFVQPTPQPIPQQTPPPAYPTPTYPAVYPPSQVSSGQLHTSVQ